MHGRVQQLKTLGTFTRDTAQPICDPVTAVLFVLMLQALFFFYRHHVEVVIIMQGN